MPVQLFKVDRFLVEVSQPDTPQVIGGDDELVGGLERVAEAWADAKDTIAEVCNYVHGAFTAANSPDELKVKFGIKLAGEAGVPFVTKGTAEASINIEVTWRNAPKQQGNDL